jgi:glycosyltransferase involved in cell wall biosynthesis
MTIAFSFVQDIDKKSDITRNRILISICIPTFNRAQCLAKTLLSIVQQDSFDDRCEIIVSDNNSQDNTREIANQFQSRYQNIRYHCNEVNVGAESNFITVMNLAKGKYIKLHSDNRYFRYNALSDILKAIEIYDYSVIFILNQSLKTHLKGTFECNSFDKFMDIVSFYSTWLSGIIVKNNDYKLLENKERMLGSSLIQTDILFRILSINNNSVIINDRLFDEDPFIKKGGFNFLDIFITNYFSLLDEYVKSGLLSPKTFCKEKYSLFKDYIVPWYGKSIFLRKVYSFDMTNARQIIMKYYGKEPYLYLSPFFFISVICKKINLNRLKSLYNIYIKRVSY